MFTPKNTGCSNHYGLKCRFSKNELQVSISFVEAVMKLVISERKSLLVLTYIILTIMAFYGPNAELLGNIKLTIWQYERPILDIQHYILNVGLLLAVDVLSFVVNGIALWKLCNINVFESMKKLQKDFWMIFAVGESVLLMEVKINVSNLN